MKRIAKLVSLLGMCFVAFLGAAREVGELGKYLAELASDNMTVRESAAQGILLSRQREIASIERIVREFVRDGTRKGTAKTAILLLGNLRSDQSVPLLVENLSFEVFYKDTKRPQPPEDLYPCVGALIRIGMPSVAPVLSRAESSDDQKISRCAGCVVQGVLGRKLAVAHVRERMEGLSDTAEHKRLEALLQNMGPP